MRPIVVLLLDGLGDRAYPELGGRSANEAAATPNLDALCGRGSCGLLWPLGPGRAPSSELAHWAMLGYRTEELPGRAVLEALGHGQEVDPGDVVAYAALRSAERRGDELWLTGRPGPHDEADAAALVASLDGGEAAGLVFSLAYLGRGEAILRISGGADDRVTDTDPFFRDRLPLLRPRPLVPDAAPTASAVERWTRATLAALTTHRVNAARTSRGASPLNAVTLKWWGRRRPAPSFAERHGLAGAVIGASPFLAGLAHTLELGFVEAPESGDPQADLEARLREAAGLLDGGASFVWAHQKAVDEAGHTKDPRAKARVLEALDRPLGRLAEAPLAGAVVCVTGDHATPATPEVIHSGDPVPFVVAGPGVPADRVERFGELECREGLLGHLRGEDVMPVLLNAASRPLFAGSRPTAVPGAAGFPSTAEPLRLT